MQLGLGPSWQVVWYSTVPALSLRRCLVASGEQWHITVVIHWWACSKKPGRIYCWTYEYDLQSPTINCTVCVVLCPCARRPAAQPSQPGQWCWCYLLLPAFLSPGLARLIIGTSCVACPHKCHHIVVQVSSGQCVKVGSRCDLTFSIFCLI
jgi:hypothetical protein